MINNMGNVLPLSEKKKLFSKFYQTDSSDKRAKEGSGLGLYLSQKILEQHKSVMDFNSSEAEGTTFFFDLGQSKEPQVKPASLLHTEAASNA
jgi:signal transduction histidine kinase